MGDVTLTPVAGDPWNGGARDLAPVTAPPLTVSLGATPQPDPAPYGAADPPSPDGVALQRQSAALGQSLASGHSGDDLVNWLGSNLPQTSSPALAYGTAAAAMPLVAGARAVDGLVNSAQWAHDVQTGRYGTFLDNPDADARVVPGAVQAAMTMGAPGLGMAEEGALGAAGGKAMAAAPDRYHLDASTLGDINELLGLGRNWKAPDPHAAMNDALRDFVPPQTQGYQRPPVVKALDPDSDTYNVFHGTGATQDFSRFDPTVSSVNVSKHQGGALFFSPDPEEAGSYARMGVNDLSDFQRTAGPRVIPASVDPGRTQLYDLGAMLDARDPRLMQGMRDIAGEAGRSPDTLGAMVDYEIRARAARAAAGQSDPGVPLALGAHNAAIGMAKAEGMDTAIIRGLAESGGGDQLAVLTPNRVSSAIDGRTLYAGGIPGSQAAMAAQQAPAQPETQAALLARMLRQGGA